MAFNGRFVVNMAFLAQNQGIQVSDILGNLPQSLDELCQEDCVITNSEYNEVIERAVTLTKDPHFGLHAGEHLNLSAAGLIGQITQNSATVKQALQYCCDFANLGCSVLPMSLVTHKNYLKVVISPDLDWANGSEIAFQQTVNGVIAFSIREIESLIPNKIPVVKVTLPWMKPLNTAEFERILNAEVLFDQNEIAIYLDQEVANSRIINSDYELLRILVAHAETKSQQYELQQGFSNTVRKSVVRLIKPEFPTIDQVASHLNMSTRTLQRKLKSEGITYQQMLHEIRFDLAKDYLRNQNLTVKEISYLLGYSESSVFVKAFKTWAGITALEYRTQHIKS